MTKGKTLRSIKVGANRYLWLIRRIDPHFVVIRIWAAERSRRDFPLEVRLRYDDPWLHYGQIITAPPGRAREVYQLVPVTPGVVRVIIESALAAGWGPHHPPDCRLFERHTDGHLVPVANPGIVGVHPWASKEDQG